MKSDLDTLMREKNLDAIMVLGNAENNPPMYYLTGGGHVSAATLIKKSGEAAVLYCNDMEREEAAKSGLRTELYSKFPLKKLMEKARGDLNRVLALRLQLIFDEMGLTRGRIGIYGHIELSNVFGALPHLQKLLPGITLVGESSMDSVFSRAMETKEEAEVERIRRMGAITTDVVGLTVEFLISQRVRDDEVLLKGDGTPLTIADVKQKINLWLAVRSAVPSAGYIFSIGRDAGIPHSVGNPDDLIRLGQTILFDLYPQEQGGGYFFDFTRTWCLGYAPPAAQELYDQVKEVYDLVTESMEMNVPFKEYQRMTCECFQARGHSTKMTDPTGQNGYVHSLGHGVGINVHERPFSSLLTTDDHRLAAGVVVAVEPGLYYPDKGMGVRIEDTYWVRPDGEMEILAEYPYDFVLPMKTWKKD